MLTKTLEELYLGHDATFRVSSDSFIFSRFCPLFHNSLLKLFNINILWRFRVMLKMFLKDLSKVLKRL